MLATSGTSIEAKIIVVLKLIYIVQNYLSLTIYKCDLQVLYAPCEEVDLRAK